MKRELAIVCDVDGVINVLGDENFSRVDMTEQMLFGKDGKPRVNLTFSPALIEELNGLTHKVKFFMLTSWNERVRELMQVGLAPIPFLPVNRIGEDSERDSKIEHIIMLSEKHTIIWIDDFAEEWFPMLPKDIKKHVHPIQPNHHQGIESHTMIKIHSLIAENIKPKSNE